MQTNNLGDDDRERINPPSTMLNAQTPPGRVRRPGAMSVLVVEDDAVQRLIIERCLALPGRERITATFCGSVAEATALLADSRYDCVVLDHKLPDGIGAELLDEAEEHLLTTPVIGLSASAEASVAVHYFRHGCTEFLRKADALKADTLRRGIAAAVTKFQRRALATIIERRELREAIVSSQERLITLARVDHLTGICNRAVYDDLHPQFHDEAVQREGCYAVCMIDVDNFKAYNDLYGHAAGDDALHRVAQIISGSLRENDFTARYGGEEFVLLLDEVTTEGALMVADRVRRLIFDAEVPHAGNAPLGRLTISIGVAVFGPQCRIGAKPLRVRADEALYRAKAQGRNVVVLAGEPVVIEDSTLEGCKTRPVR